MTKTCLQCGAVQNSDLRVCDFCDSPLTADRTLQEQSIAIDTQGHPAISSGADGSQDAAWRNELTSRLAAYRVRRKKAPPDSGQSQLPFRPATEPQPDGPAIAICESAAEEKFSFSIAIGRCGPKGAHDDGCMLIDVSTPPKAEGVGPRSSGAAQQEAPCLCPAASLDDRRLAAVIDIVCLLFAYGGFLALFGSLGGQFTLSKLSAAVYVATFAIVYLQYFFLFTIFGGTTPGMMLRGLQVASFSGEPPTPRQMLLRSVGYVISAGTFFMGFLWAMWDEDELTWHDRMSRTYLGTANTLADLETHGATHSH